MNDRPRKQSGRAPAIIRLVLIVCLLGTAPAFAGPAVPDRDQDRTVPDGIHVLDGSCVLNIGELHVNITNHGLIGSQYTQTFPYSVAPSAQWPGGSGDEYMFAAGLWVGGKVNGQGVVTTGQPERELRPALDVLSTIYESRDKQIVKPWPSGKQTGHRLPDDEADDDRDGQYDEDMMNGRDDDGDGEIDEDYGQIGDQMFTCSMYDGLPLVQEIYPDHQPLNIEVVQRAAAWSKAGYRDMAVFDFEIINRGLRVQDDIYLGFYMDGDIQRRGDSSSKHDDLAGLWSGVMRSQYGEFHRIEVAWMKDADPDDPLEGWIGAILLDHDTDFLQYRAPRRVTLNSFQIFATNAQVNQDGEPLSDADRYTVMSQNRRDPDRRVDQPGDLKVLISSGPFNYLRPGQKLSYRVGLVVGTGLQGMLQSALRASEMAQGHWFDLDNNWLTGTGGLETQICVGDVPPYSNGQERFYGKRWIFADDWCTGSHARPFIDVIWKDGMELLPDGRRCTWVNADNCEEYFRATGQEHPYDPANDYYFNGWQGRIDWDGYPSARIFTGRGGRETRLPWAEFQEYPPRPPAMRLVPGDNQVEVFWDDISEYDPDYLRGVPDFESYRVWRVAGWTRPAGTSNEDGPTSEKWGMIAEYDLANFIPPEASYSGQRLALGRNTGLEPAVYVPACLSDPRFVGLAEEMAVFVQADSLGRYPVMPPLRDHGGNLIPGGEGLVPWEAWPTVLDTFFAVTPRDDPPGRLLVGKRSTRYYHHLDTEVNNGFEAFYSVVASDHQLKYLGDDVWVPKGAGIQSTPGNNYQRTMPATAAQTAEDLAANGRNIYVFPNPATREALAEFQKQPASGSDPTGERVMFNNLPAAVNTITIYSASGDLIETIEHDGRGGNGAASWNLISRNGQEVVSGVYLYAVETDDENFDTFHGRFVLIR